MDNMILIDDTYNANPSSTAYSISVLNRIKTYPRKIAVLGDMFELGEKAGLLHKNLLKVIKKEQITEVYTLGALMKNLNEELKKVGTIKNRHFASRSTLKKFLETKDLTNSVILVKGSRGMKMEEFVNVIKEL
jgi:UDP-N-acetylmuramoyl-tripeptide--D-alanyl-D-alanine ligase